MKRMKRICLLTIVFLLAAGLQLHAQLKTEEQSGVGQSMVRPAQSISSFLGLLNPENFMMRHSISLGYYSAGGAGMSLASYTNSMFYKIADPLNVRVDLTLQGSPFGQSRLYSSGELNKLYISNAELNYRPADNMFIKLQYSQLPLGLYGYGDYYPYRTSPFLRDP